MLNNEVFIQLSIQNFDKNPSYITKYLGIEPSKVWSKNDLKTEKGSIKYNNNGWEIRFKKNNVLHVDILLKEIIMKLSSKKTELARLNNVSKKISIVVYSKKMMPSFVYDHDIISFLHETNIYLEQDIYCIN
jgi:transposase